MQVLPLTPKWVPGAVLLSPPSLMGPCMPHVFWSTPFSLSSRGNATCFGFRPHVNDEKQWKRSLKTGRRTQQKMQVLKRLIICVNGQLKKIYLENADSLHRAKSTAQVNNSRLLMTMLCWSPRCLRIILAFTCGQIKMQLNRSCERKTFDTLLNNTVSNETFGVGFVSGAAMVVTSQEVQ